MSSFELLEKSTVSAMQLRLLALTLLLLPAVGRAEPAVWPACESRPLPAAPAAELHADPTLVEDLHALLRDAVASGETHSAALVLVRRGKVLYRGAAGSATTESLFDVASLTKVVATAPAVMKLVEEGRLGLDDHAARYLPQLMGGGAKRGVTVRQLLLHTSGYHSVVPAGKLSDGHNVILDRVRAAELRAAPGAAYRYSDVGYIVLSELVAARAGVPLDMLVQARLFEPLRMCSTGFRPPVRVLARTVSPWPAGVNSGLVYDPLAARLGGLAGHAGLFSTAEDLARFAQMMLGGGQLEGTRVLGATTVARMVSPNMLPGKPEARRGLGWDISSPHSGSRGALSSTAYGHCGYTGTSIYVDPERELAVVLLTNRTHLEPAPSVSALRRRVHNLVVAALAEPPRQRVRSGLDRLIETEFKALAGKRVGLITNRTAVDARGQWVGDLLLKAPAVSLQALFVPEHGLDAVVDRRISDSVLRSGGRRVPVYSLFGERRRPGPELLEGIDTLVFDVATVGVRYYTYLSTLGWAMEEAAKHGLRFVVLDRPNPLGGLAVQGPVSSEARRTSTNYHPLPVRYGMTVGELARLFNGERRLQVSLEVVPVAGWRREQLFNSSGVPWVNPSPNIRSWRQALLYSAVGLLESTPLSVGRGTESPFQIVGAPWIDGPSLASELNRRRIAGVHFVPVSFRPKANPYKGQECHGVRLLALEPGRLDPVAAGIALAVALRKLHPQSWETRNLYRLINHPATTEAILAGKDLAEIRALWAPGLRAFDAVRTKYLLY